MMREDQQDPLPFPRRSILSGLLVTAEIIGFILSSVLFCLVMIAVPLFCLFQRHFAA